MDDTLFAGSCATEPGGANGLWHLVNGVWYQALTECVYDISLVPGGSDRVHIGTDDGVKLYDASDDAVVSDWTNYFVGDVYDIVSIDYGTFYAGGDFTATDTRDGTVSKNVALIDYTCPGGMCAYHVIDNDGGVSSPVYALVRDGEDLYAGGAFVQTESAVSSSYLARWDGSDWQSVAEGGSQGANNTVTALAFSDDRLYAFGDFTPVPGLSVPPVRRSGRTRSTLTTSVAIAGHAKRRSPWPLVRDAL